MDADFWHQRWQDHNIGFHEGKPNALLVRHLARLSLKQGDRVFVPLCGKTYDLAYLRSQGFKLVGVELSAIAIDELFKELGIIPTIREVGTLKHYSASSIDIFVGDFFALDTQILGKVDAVFDRAALVALPDEMRQRYSNKLQALTPTAPQLLIVFEYQQAQMKGPPFSISTDEVTTHYGAHYQCVALESRDSSALFGNKLTVAEHVYLLNPQTNAS